MTDTLPGERLWRPEALLQPDGLEWHVMLGTRDPSERVVGLVEAVNEVGITVTRLDRELGPVAGDERFLRWDEIVLLMMCGPDRDDDLFAAADSWEGRD
jgi:hypothetical protein